jgi:NAD(P)-dependent dehydrogenase (short-subunit alcohol dehydrogenase family)
VVGDVCDEGAREKTIKIAIEKTGSLDILVNNAAVFLLAGLDATEEQWQRTFEVNLLAGANLVTQAVSEMRKSPHPTIVNITSISSHRAQAGRWTYNAMKGAHQE